MWIRAPAGNACGASSFWTGRPSAIRTMCEGPAGRNDSVMDVIGFLAFCLIAFVVLCTWNAVAQNKIDEEFGVHED